MTKEDAMVRGREHRRQVWCRRAVWALVLLLASAAPAIAQFDRGAISGTIKDEQGGVIPGVTVTATNTQTQQLRSTITDGTGFYTFPNLLPGQYDLLVELQGFKKISRQNVPLDANGAITLDFALQTGVLSEEVFVTAVSPPLQTDVALRKTVEAKDIEQLSFSGRNPIGVVSLKAGVVGGNFNSRGFSDLGNGGFNINGSRTDENNITIDGATAIRTRSANAIVGIQNVDAIQEVQILTANYMPEYGRVSGGQIRFVTKSGSSHYSGSGSYFLRDDKLQANTWARNRSPNATENSGPAPFNYKQYGFALGGPVPGSIFTNRLFFFAAQEWVNYFAVVTNSATVPSAAMRIGDFSELLNPANSYFGRAITINNPLTGQPFPGNIIPASQLSANGLAMLNVFPLATPGYQQGTNNAIFSSENPQDQRKDNIRFDYRLNNSNQVTFRYSKYNWTAIDPFRPVGPPAGFPFARTDWDRPNSTQTVSWTSTIRNNLINEVTYTHSLDQVFINVFTGNDLYKRSRTGINYPYIFPANKEIADKIPTISIANFTEIDGGPYPSSSQGPIHTISDAATLVKGRHTFKAGAVVEYSGEDDFDQINVQAIPGSTNNQNGRFEFLDNRSGGTGLAVANVAMGLFSNYAEIGQRAFTQWRSVATDVFVQDSWKPASNLTIEGGVRWVYWPPYHSTTNNIANFEPQFYNRATAAIIDPATGRITGGNRYDGIVLPGSGFEGDGQNLAVARDPAVLALFQNQPVGFSKTYANAFEPRLGLAYSMNEKTILRASAGVFHNRVTLNDSSLLGGNPPFQPQVSVSNGSADNPGAGGAANLPFSMTAQDVEFKHPTSYMWATGVQREMPFGFVLDVTYVGRLGRCLQRERNINQLLPGTLQANPGVNIAALRPYLGYGAIRLAENAGESKYNSLQLSADRRYANGLKIGAAYTLSKSLDNGSTKRDVVWNTYDDTGFWGPSSFDRRHVLNVYYIYDLPFWKDQSTALKNALGGWQVSGASFFRTGTPFSVTRTNDIAGVGDGNFNQPFNLVGDPLAGANRSFSAGSGNDQNYWINPAAFAAPAAGTFGNAPRDLAYNPGEQQWDMAFFKNFRVAGSQRLQFRAEMFNFINHPNWNNVASSDPSNANFGRITTKRDERRDVQLSLRYVF
ncbi:MAG: TonB-dependent receptor [Acidobacteria bacterium]|nr:MAG: TonB-dependent receptor [Acidobacteriota bacterium]